jgi:hypothetical protein
MFFTNRLRLSRVVLPMTAITAVFCITPAKNSATASPLVYGVVVAGALTEFSSNNGYVIYNAPDPSYGEFDLGEWQYASEPGYGINVLDGSYSVTGNDAIHIPFRLQCEGNTSTYESYSGKLVAEGTAKDSSSGSVAIHFQSVLGPPATVSVGANETDSDEENFSGSVQLDSSQGADFEVIVTASGEVDI